METQYTEAQFNINVRNGQFPAQAIATVSAREMKQAAEAQVKRFKQQGFEVISEDAATLTWKLVSRYDANLTASVFVTPSAS